MPSFELSYFESTGVLDIVKKELKKNVLPTILSKVPFVDFKYVNKKGYCVK